MRVKPIPKRRSEINMLPLMDSMFLLLVFFIYSMMSMVTQQGIPVNLPKAASQLLKPEESYTISIDADNQLYFQKKPVTKTELRDILTDIKSQYHNPTHNPLQGGAVEEPVIILHADTATSHGNVIGVLDILRQLNIESVSFETQESE